MELHWFNHKVVCHLKCYSRVDSVAAAAVRGLSPYPVVRKPAKMSVFPDGTQRDEAGGKPILITEAGRQKAPEHSRDAIA